MSRTQPFRTTRPTGSPSAGGSEHTLAAHMAANAAHPQYVRKGDAVGDSNLAGHEADKNAHVRHYLRRAEVGLTLAHFNDSKGVMADSEHYSAENAGYRTVVSTYLLNLLLNTPEGLAGFPGISSRSDVVINFAGDTVATGSVSDPRIPGWEIFNQLVGFVRSVYIGGQHALTVDHPFYSSSADDTEAIRQTNPLARIFATKGHTHSEYLSRSLVKGSTSILTFDDIIDPLNPDVIAARSDHTHSEYITEDDLDRLGVAFDPNHLREVGIWETAVATPEGIDTGRVYSGDLADLNLYATQGNYTFNISKDDLSKSDTDYIDDLHFPEKYIDSVEIGYTTASEAADLGAMSGSLKTVSVLQVTGAVNPLIKFGVTDISKHIVTFSKSHTYQAINQRLLTDAPLLRLSNESVGGGDASKLREYKDAVRGVYTRTGYSLDTAWYISSVLNIIGHTVKTFLESARGINVASAVASAVSYAIGLFNSNDDKPDNVTLGYYKYPYDVTNPALAKKFRLDPRLAHFNSNVKEISPSADYSNTSSSIHRLVFNKYSGTRDISKWITPGLVDKVNGVNCINVSSATSTLTALAPSSKDIYIPYLDYYTVKATWPSVNVTTAGTDTSYPGTVAISQSVDYYDGSTHTKLTLSDGVPTPGSCPFVNIIAPDPSITNDYVGSDANGYIAVVPSGVDGADTMSKVLMEFKKNTGTSWAAGNVYARKQASKNSNTCAYAFTVVPSTEYTVGTEITDNSNLYVATIVAATGYTPSADNYGWMWSKHLVRRTGTTDAWSRSRRYYKYNVARHAFEDITSDLDEAMSVAGSTTISADLEGFGFPIFTDFSIVRVTTSNTKITPIAGQYVVPKVTTGTAVYGVDYVKFAASEVNNDIISSQTSNLAAAYTTGFILSGTTHVQVAHLITDGSDVVVDGETISGAKTLSQIKTVRVTSPSKVGDDGVYSADKQYVRVQSSASCGYVRDNSVTSANFASMKSSLYSIDKDTDTVEYLMTGEEFPSGSTYGIKLPRYDELLSEKMTAITPVYLRAFFYPTVDTSAVTGKTYYKKSEITGVYAEESSPTFTDTSDTLYEMVDLDTFFDVWCAIKQLTSTGSEHNSTYPNCTKYSIGDNGELVAWDDWQQLVTGDNSEFSDFVSRTDAFKFAVDTFLPDFYSAMDTAGYNHATETNRKDGLGDLWNLIKWFNPASGALTETKTTLLLGFDTNPSTSTYKTRASDAPKTAGDTSRVSLTTNTNKSDTRLRYKVGSSLVELANMSDLARKAGVDWVDSLEARIETLESYDLGDLPDVEQGLTDLNEIFTWLKTSLPSGGSLVVTATTTDKNIYNWIGTANPGDTVKLSSTITVGGSPFSILDIPEDGYGSYQFSIVVKTANGGYDGSQEIENPIAEVELKDDSNVYKGSMYVPASSLLWVVTKGTNHGVYFKVPRKWVNVYDIPASQDVEVYLRVRYFGTSGGGLGQALRRRLGLTA